ncbi:MAG: glycosyltransferase family 4 protein [Actinobacteria bacterium]|nr:glycosyltransferase family 4 protein [Actinomycetota bacterium]
MSTKINILYISRTSKITGPENVLLDIIKRIDKNSFYPMVVLPDNKGLFYKKLNENNITALVVRMPFLRVTYNPFLLVWFLLNVVFINLRFCFVLKEKKVDIVVCNTIQEALYISLPAKILKKKSIICIKNILDKNWKKYIRAKFCKIFADKIIAVSRKAAEDYTSLNFKNDPRKNKIIVINDGIECSEYIKDFKEVNVLDKYLNREINEFIILNIGNLTELKGQMLLLEAVSILNSSNIDLKVFMAGDIYHQSEMAYKNRLIDYIACNNLNEKVVMLGYQEDIRSLISEADILVHCPIKEDAFPRVILEAFCFGKIVLATKIGGIPEMITDNYNGFLCETSGRDLAEKILYIYDNRDKFEYIKKNAAKAVKKDFNLRNNVLEIEKIYKELFSGSNKPFG